jgi:hypothetical protein
MTRTPREKDPDRIGPSGPPRSKKSVKTAARKMPVAHMGHPRPRRGSARSPTMSATSGANSRSRGSAKGRIAADFQRALRRRRRVDGGTRSRAPRSHWRKCATRLGKAECRQRCASGRWRKCATRASAMDPTADRL